MGNPQPTASNGSTLAGQLRENVLTYFEVDDLESLCFDLGLDYSGLPGDGKAAKVVAMLEYFGRNGRIADLINRCAQSRPNVSWDALRAAAAANPALFNPVTPDEGTTTGGKNILNLPPDRALKYGIAVGALVVLLLVCGFSGGILANNFVSITLKPVPSSPTAGAAALSELAALQGLAPSRPVQLSYDNIKATSLADDLLVVPDSPISEIHVQFLASGDVALNMRIKVLGNRRVVVGTGVRAENGRLVLAPKSVVLNVIEIQGSTFGWLPVPTSFLSSLFTWAQEQLDLAAQTYWFQSIHISEDRMDVVLRRR